MRLRTSSIFVIFSLLTVTALAAPFGLGQHKAQTDVISGEWDAVLTTEDNTVQLTLKLKVEGNKVTGSFESSHLGSGTISNGSWANNTLKLMVESDHAPVELTGTLKNGKLIGQWDAGHLQGNWEAKKK